MQQLPPMAAMNNPTPLKPVKGKTVLRLDDMGRRVAARRIADAKSGNPDRHIDDIELRELLELVQP